MDPLSVTAACVSLLSGLTTVSTKIRSLVIDAKNTSREVIALQNELDSLQRSLGIFYGGGLADGYPVHLQSDLETIIRECQFVVREIDALLDKVVSSHVKQRIQWSFSVRDEVSRLHRNLEGHKSAITIAIAFASMSTNRGIKSDTSSIRSKAARIPDMQNQLAAVLDAIQALQSGDPSQRQQLSLAMQRFLQEAYTESISGTLRRSGSTITYESMLQSSRDPFEDPKSEIDIQFTEQAGLEVDNRSRATHELDADMPSGQPRPQYDALLTSSDPTLTLDPQRNRQRFQELKASAVTHVDTAPEVRKPPSKKRLSLSISLFRPKKASSTLSQEQQPDSTLFVVTTEWLRELSALLDAALVALLKSRDASFERSASIFLHDSHMQAGANNNSASAAAFQEAIRLHQAGEYKSATSALKMLAERGNISSQIIYAMSLCHGWGCSRRPDLALLCLLTAGKTSIEYEMTSQADQQFFTTSSRDELKLALFEIGNSKRYGWGCVVDAKSTRMFYNASAILEDVDAMQELAWCYLTGFGGKKDKFAAAQLLRKAETHGSKVLGNSWIWKDKYNHKSNVMFVNHV
ncbi:hypothetical protein H2198_001069 [Neophaeococcomyces mojaviensis]|uniref:Uncharacterized protein n=1 Tax=Neophaeococcomyces mojaviensis TaxID=3383035 RepID=A0ACC3AI67_9EURO|nr:hypothetical protein H2198_001069 [Knufia sp. JES_112]